MIRLNIVKTTVLPLALLSAALVTPAYASWFYDRELNIRLNVGSAPNPTPQDLREKRSPDYPLISRSLNEQGTVGLKIALQYWRQQREPARRRFVCFRRTVVKAARASKHASIDERERAVDLTQREER